MGERSLPVSPKLTHDVMAINRHTSALIDRVPSLYRSRTVSHESGTGVMAKIESLSSLEQSNNQTLIKGRLSQLTSCLRKYCCCRCSSKPVMSDTDVVLPLLTESPSDVIQTQKTLPSMANIVSKQPNGNTTDETSSRLSQRDWTKKFSKVSISDDHRLHQINEAYLNGML